MKITNFLALDGMGDKILADAHGNNIAFSCFQCDHPVLAVALKNQRGSDEEHPAICKGCGARYFLDVRSHMEKLYVHSL
jgi:transcription elongation factor Elf1